MYVRLFPDVNEVETGVANMQSGGLVVVRTSCSLEINDVQLL